MRRATEQVIIVGQPATCQQVQRQLGLMAQPPRILGCILASGSTADSTILGTLDELEALAAEHKPDAVLVSLPAAFAAQITAIRTRLRKIGIPDRFIPTLDDLLDGVGPRTEFELDVQQLIGRPPRPIDSEAVERVLRDRRVLITGAGGSIGGELARMAARHKPQSLILVERSENALFEIDRQIARFHPDLPRQAVLHDVVDAAATLDIFRRHRPEIVFHAAAHKHVPMMENHPAAAIDNNFFGTVAAADASAMVGAERFILISTDKAVRPKSVMGATKRLAELYVQHLNQQSPTACSMVRFGNVLGSSGSVLETWKRQLADGGPLTVTDPRMTRYFMTIPEAASLVIQAAGLVDGADGRGEVYVLNMGEPVRIVDLARRFIELHGLKPVVNGGEMGDGTAAPGQVEILFSGVRPGEKLFEQLAFDAEVMRPTRHPDIHIWELPAPAPQYIAELLHEFGPDRRPAEGEALAAMLHEALDDSTAKVAA